MRNYWLRIALGAFGIFAVGMIISTVVRRGKDAMKGVLASDRPITLPLALIPFSVDGHALGTMRQVQILRSDPETVKAVKFRVRLADSVSDDRLGQCVLVVGGSLKHVEAEHAFSCVTSADTVGNDLAPVGEVRTQRGETYTLFAKAGALDSVKLDFGHDREMADSIREAQQEFADSVRDAEQERADSIRESAMGKADSIRAAADAMSDSIHAHIDSVIQARQSGTKPAEPPRVKVKSSAKVDASASPKR